MPRPRPWLLATVLLPCLLGAQCAPTEPPDCAPAWPDIDGDGFGAGQSELRCDLTTGWTRSDTDCDDGDITVFPGNSPDVCDQRDNDCDGRLDEDPEVIFFPDEDGDGFGLTEEPRAVCPGLEGDNQSRIPGDCDDTDAERFPGAEELCNAVDDNCDTVVDDGLERYLVFADRDEDGFGDPADSWEQCPRPWLGQSLNSEDCDDSRWEARPDRPERCDGIDNDCDGEVDEGEGYYVDLDGDGFGVGEAGPCTSPGLASEAGDCDDEDAGFSPMAVDWCDTPEDEDCSGVAATCTPMEDLAETADAHLFGTDNSAGYAAGVGDLNGDGFGDLAIAAPWRTGDGVECYSGDCDCPWWGSVYIVFGPVEGEIELNDTSTQLHRQYLPRGTTFAGDLNQDGWDDLVFWEEDWVQGFDCVDIPGYGDLYLNVVYGPIHPGDRFTPDWEAQLWDYVLETRGQVIAGDVTGDGIPDLTTILPTHGEGSSEASRGLAHVFPGPWPAPQLPPITVRGVGETGIYRDASVAPTPWNSESNELVLASLMSLDSGARVGLLRHSAVASSRDVLQADSAVVDGGVGLRIDAVVSADLNGDGHPDLAAGQANRGGTRPDGTHLSLGGVVSIWFGPAEGNLSTTEPDVLMFGDRNWDAGWVLASDDWNGDGYADLLIGGGGGNSTTLWFGPIEPGSYDLSTADRVWGYHSSSYEPLQYGSARDVDADGFRDLVLGFPSGRGDIYLLYGGPAFSRAR